MNRKTSLFALLFRLVPLLLLCLAPSVTGASVNKEQPVNIALGKSYTLQPAPNYRPCTDPDDAVQLTDGWKVEVATAQTKEEGRQPWVQEPTVGWAKPRGLVTITIDLEREEAISGVVFRTAAGGGGVSWPAQIEVFAGQDAENWRSLGNLRIMSERNRPAPSDGGGYGGVIQHEFITHQLKTRARYVRFVMAGSAFVFSDEIEIYSGDPGWKGALLEGEALKGDDAVRDFVMQRRTRAGYDLRLLRDRRVLEEKVAASSLPEKEKKRLRTQIAKGYDDAMAKELPGDADFRAVIPFNGAHAAMYAAQGRLWQEELGKTTVIESPHRYQWIDFEHRPVRATTQSRLTMEMLGKEFRSDLLLLGNPSETPREMKIEVEGIKGDPGWLRVFTVPWTDTLERLPVSTALVEVPAMEGVVSFPLLSGVPTKLWLMVDSSRLRAGKHSGALIISDVEGRQAIPFEVRVSEVTMPKPPLNLFLWDYVHPPYSYGITEGNAAASVKLMKEYYVNMPWAAPRGLPRVSGEDFDRQNRLKAPLDTSVMEQWMTEIWPGADRYLYFMGFDYRQAKEPAFAGVKAGDPAFEPRIAAWLQAITARMEAIGIDPSRLAILPLDEIKTEEQFKVMRVWIAALKKADPRVRVLMNPATPRIAKIDTHGALDLVNTICPNRFSYLSGRKAAESFYHNLLSQGKELQFYSCSGPVRTADPTYYYRLSSWFALSKGATGIGFWAFGSTGRAASSWNEYTAESVSYSPAFLSGDSASPSIHLEALREGIQDYTLLEMLKSASEERPSDVEVVRAQKVLRSAYGLLTEDNAGEDKDDQFTRGMWFQETGRPDLPDALRVKALHCLEKLLENEA